MKINAILLLMFLISTVKLTAQPNKARLPKIHAYSKEVLGGASPRATIDENGNTQQKQKKPSYQYYLYIETANNQSIDIRYLWMDGKAYKISRQKVALPIVVPGMATPSSAKGDTLIASGKNSFWKIDLNGIAVAKQKPSVNKLLQSNALVIEYVYKGKGYLLAGKEINKLSPVVLQ
jgi:hypothetical protein